MFVCRSFNDKPVNESAVGPLGKELFEREQDDLLSDLKDFVSPLLVHTVFPFSRYFMKQKWLLFCIIIVVFMLTVLTGRDGVQGEAVYNWLNKKK